MLIATARHLVCRHSLRFTRASEAKPSAAAKPARALGLAVGDFFLTRLVGGGGGRGV
jgi:hypothetical protein